MIPTRVADAIAVTIPTLLIALVASVLRGSSQMAAWTSVQRASIAHLVHAASRQDFAASQDRNKYMKLMNSTAATAQLEAARRILTDEDLSRVTGTDVRKMAHKMEQHQRKIISQL